MNRLMAGTVQVGLRTIWPPLYVIWLRLQVEIWGTAALEHAVAFSPPWLALRILTAYGVQIGPGIDFHGRLQLHGTYVMRDKLKIGAECHIGPNVTLDLTWPVVIEDRCTVSLNAQIITHMDVGYSPLGEIVYPTQGGSVVVETGAYIGAGAIILMGTRIGHHSIVAAGALVRHDVPPFSVVAGVPAQIIKYLEPGQTTLL